MIVIANFVQLDGISLLALDISKHCLQHFISLNNISIDILMIIMHITIIMWMIWWWAVSLERLKLDLLWNYNPRDFVSWDQNKYYPLNPRSHNPETGDCCWWTNTLQKRFIKCNTHWRNINPSISWTTCLRDCNHKFLKISYWFRSSHLQRLHQKGNYCHFF